MLVTRHHNEKRCFWQKLWSLISFPYNTINTVCKYSTVVYFFLSFFYLICLDRWILCMEIPTDPEYYSSFNSGFQGVIHRPILTLVFNHWIICKTNGKAQWNKLSSVCPQYTNTMQITTVNTGTSNRLELITTFYRMFSQRVIRGF